MSRRLRPIILFLLICTQLLALWGCEKRYWYRTKIRNPFKSEANAIKTIDVEIRNESPEFISRKFEQTIRQASIRSLEKRGFMEAKKGTPQYHLTIHLRVDSFYVYGSPTGAMTGYNFADIMPRRSITSQTVIPHLRQKPSVMELSLSYRMVFPETGVIYWETGDGLYFFNEEKRDLRRSIGMIRYALSTVE